MGVVFGLFSCQIDNYSIILQRHIISYKEISLSRSAGRSWIGEERIGYGVFARVRTLLFPDRKVRGGPVFSAHFLNTRPKEAKR